MALLIVGCRTPPRPAPAAHVEVADAGVPLAALDAGNPQPGAIIADVDGTAVLALATPSFAALSQDQRMLAYWTAQAAAAGDAVTLVQNYRHNLAIVRLLRGILSRPAVAPSGLIGGLRAFARVVWLNHGLHDYETGRKATPPFTFSDLRAAALAAQAAGADLGLGGVSLEFTLRALEAPLFDPRVDALRAVHGADLTRSAVNFYDGVTLRDLRGFHERFLANSRLVKEDRALSEEVLKVPAVATALDHALPFAAPPQRAVLEKLSAALSSGDGFTAAQQPWLEAFGPVDFWLGFVDRSADPRGRKALFGAFVGLADRDRAAPAGSEALLLAAASGSMRPLRRFGFSLGVGGKSALFLSAAQAAASLQVAPLLTLLSDPFVAADMRACATSLFLSYWTLREAGRVALDDGALEEARADVRAWTSAPDVPPRCAALWPQFAATSWLASLASIPEGDRAEDDRQRAIQLQVWWFTGKGALAERRGFLAVPDAARFQKAAAELLTLLDDLQRDPTRASDLVDHHASHINTAWRDEVLSRLKSAGLPRRLAVVPPQIRAVLKDGKIADADAVPLEDLDAEVFRSWSNL